MQNIDITCHKLKTTAFNRQLLEGGGGGGGGGECQPCRHLSLGNMLRTLLLSLQLVCPRIAIGGHELCTVDSNEVSTPLKGQNPRTPRLELLLLSTHLLLLYHL